MRIPQDSIFRTNFYFAFGFVIVGLLLALIEVGIHAYRHAELSKYSSFGVLVRGESVLYVPGAQRPTAVIHQISVGGRTMLYDHLVASLGSKGAAYILSSALNDGNNEIAFKVEPQLNGDFILATPGEAGLVTYIWTRRGQQVVKVLDPGKWYTVRQVGRWFTIKLVWDK